MAPPFPRSGKASAEPIQTVWHDGAQVVVAEPTMGIYTNLPERAKCAFASRPRYSFRHPIPPTTAGVWDGAGIKAQAGRLRAAHPEETKTVSHPQKWEDLWGYYDPKTIHALGPWNVWRVLEHIAEENKLRATADIGPAMANEIADWAYQWLTWPENREKLVRWNTRRDIVSVFDEKDKEDIGTTDPVVLFVLRQELEYWYGYYRSPWHGYYGPKPGTRNLRRGGSSEQGKPGKKAPSNPPVHRNWMSRQETLLRDDEYPHRRWKSDPVQKGKHTATNGGGGSHRATPNRRKRQSRISASASNSTAPGSPVAVVPALGEGNPTVSVAVPGWPRGFYPFPHPNGAVLGCRMPVGRLVSQSAHSSQTSTLSECFTARSRVTSGSEKSTKWHTPREWPGSPATLEASLA